LRKTESLGNRIHTAPEKQEDDEPVKVDKKKKEKRKKNERKNINIPFSVL